MSTFFSSWENAENSTRFSKVSRDVLVVGTAAFIAALLGIYSRPVGFLATVWPANAVILGLMVRNRGYAAPLCWLVAGSALVTADVATGTSLSLAFWMSVANMSGVLVGYLLYIRIEWEHTQLQGPLSVMYLLIIGVSAASAAAVTGAGVEVVIFGRDPALSWISWFSSELANTLAVLPVMLTAPGVVDTSKKLQNWRLPLRSVFSQAWPAIAVAVSLIAAWWVGGPGALAFPFPALLWCALTYSRFTTALVTLVVSMSALAWLTLGGLAFSPLLSDVQNMNSVRLGVALLALGPLTVATVTYARKELVERLKRTTTHDYLTDALTRSALTRDGISLLQQLSSGGKSVAVLVCDIDNFKSINDTYGHASGDGVLVAFSSVVSQCIRSTDLFGRIGGDEFVVILSDVNRDQAEQIADRIKTQFSSLTLTGNRNRTFSASVSVGGISLSRAHSNLAHLIDVADGVLYRAKEQGRDRVMMTEYHQLSLLSNKSTEKLSH